MDVGCARRAEVLRRGMPQLATVLHPFSASRMMRDSLLSRHPLSMSNAHNVIVRTSPGRVNPRENDVAGAL